MIYRQHGQMQCDYCSAWGNVVLEFDTNEHKTRNGHKIRITNIIRIPDGWSLWARRYSSDDALILCCPEHWDWGSKYGGTEVNLSQGAASVDG